MTKTKTGGAAAADTSPSPWAGMTQAQMRAALEAYAANEQAREARDKRLAGVHMERHTGTYKDRDYDYLKLTGNAFGNYGVKIDPRWFPLLKQIWEDVQDRMHTEYGGDA
ncbi:MAG: hypothetical protein JSV86_06245 [Gemmatimonadota bacterium]|nr:MAG: hypothetical protein JSV86_06245 [Gemmatimonadota bacterium]